MCPKSKARAMGMELAVQRGHGILTNKAQQPNKMSLGTKWGSRKRGIKWEPGKLLTGNGGRGPTRLHWEC